MRLAVSLTLLVPCTVIHAQEPIDDSGSADLQLPEPILRAAPRMPDRNWHSWGGESWSALLYGAVLVDGQLYGQDAKSERQVGSLDEYEALELRGIRLGLIGTLGSEALWNWAVAVDRGSTGKWSFFDYAVGHRFGADGQLTVGKQKEPISMERLMSLINLPFMERSVGNDIFVPTRNIGVSYRSGLGEGAVSYGVGLFNDSFGSDKDLPEGSNQGSARLTYAPVRERDGGRIVHLGLNGRYSDLQSGSGRFFGAPESRFMPDHVDTGLFVGSDLREFGLEAYYRDGPLWVGSELWQTTIDATDVDDPVFGWGNVFATYTLTGEYRQYDPGRGQFRALIPDSAVNAGGSGLWEVAARYSWADLDDSGISGGTVSRFTGAVNWYANFDVRVSMNYGYVTLDRFGATGHTHVLQLRLTLRV